MPTSQVTNVWQQPHASTLPIILKGGGRKQRHYCKGAGLTHAPFAMPPCRRLTCVISCRIVFAYSYVMSRDGAPLYSP